jgi:TolA-binding protein
MAMFPEMDEKNIQDTMKAMLSALPRRELPEAKTTEFIARLYRVSEERRSVIDFVLAGRVRVFATVAASLLVAILSYNYLFMPISPVVTNVSGTVKIYCAGKNEWKFAKKNRDVRLARNDILKTFDDGQADLVIPGVYHMRVKRASEVRLAKSVSRAMSGDIKYEVVKGKTFTNYDKKRKLGKEFNIETEAAMITALGTDFMVEVVPASTWVGVLDGMVRVRSVGPETLARSSVTVEPGQKTLVRKGSAPEKPERLMENELMELEELYRIGTRPQVALLISSGRTRTRELLTATPLYVSSRKPGVLPAQMEAIVKTFNEAIKSRSKERYAANVRQFEELLEKYPDPKYNVQLSLFIAAYYEHLGEHDKAIESFRKVTEKYPGSALASIAQCAIGIIYEEKLGDTAQAKQAYETVIAKYPDSPEAEEAKEGLERLSR